ncbi:hypothetical protein [Salinimicrobium oceani]|uniref:Trigger factor n=1 Tax=Salinimicrobium oceani TaxID=2722702 RepID=A0ABX1CZX8_9FLAO|nr:hypothetical protein [Salinimicrobium oceani]NJW53565.1 hypothetical protein [Salinimicrobium oceani]
MDKKEKTYKIKVPVYSSELFENTKGLFEGHSYEDMIGYLDRKIDEYSRLKPKLSRKRRNKIKEIEVQNIENHNCQIGKIPARLVKITAYNTNLMDGYVETNEKINLTKQDKVGSETNFMLLYPTIFGMDSNKYQYQWKILLYEDPTKDNHELTSICKLVLDKVLNIKVANIKLERVLKKLSDRKVISELKMEFKSQTYDENEIDTNLKQYLISASLIQIKNEKFQNVPFEDAEKLINDKEYEKDFQKRVLKFILNKKEIKLTSEYVEAQETIKETVEEIFNPDVIIGEVETEKLFDIEFIIDKLTPVLQEYLSENE